MEATGTTTPTAVHPCVPDPVGSVGCCSGCSAATCCWHTCGSRHTQTHKHTHNHAATGQQQVAQPRLTTHTTVHGRPCSNRQKPSIHTWPCRQCRLLLRLHCCRMLLAHLQLTLPTQPTSRHDHTNSRPSAPGPVGSVGCCSGCSAAACCWHTSNP
jgi:hypothetical protein